MRKGMSVELASDTQVVCSKPMDDSMKSLFIRALATPSYSTNPVYRYRLTAIQIGEQTTVSIDPFVQYANAYGQVNTIPITNKKERAIIRSELDALKAGWEQRLASGQSPITAPTQPTAPTAALPRSIEPPTPNHPSAPAAKQALGQLQCFDGFRQVGASGSGTLFEATCPGGATRLVSCTGGSCRVLQ